MDGLSAMRAIRLGCAVTACVAALSLATNGSVARGQAATKESLGLDDPMSGPRILAKLKTFREVGSVLMVAAHPDDENTQLLAYLENGRHYRTAYLSVTRGDGGQNLLGPEFGPTLGVIRTQELLAARRIDGPEQFFTRALDFGFSKDYQDTLQRWGHKAVLGDVVRVVREFRPDVIVARFSPEPSATHGHHTASAVLAEEAFKAAADPKMYPEQGLAPWQAKRVVVNRGGPGGGGGGGVQMDISGNDEATGESYASMAGRSRAMHKTQGFGSAGNGGGRAGGGGGGPRMESFELLAGEPMSKDLLDGVDTTWGRVEGGAEIGKMADGVIAGFDVKNPAGSVDGVLAMRKVLLALPGKDPIVERKRLELDRVLQGCLGLTVDTKTNQAEVVLGEPMVFDYAVFSKLPLKWIGIRFPAISKEITTKMDVTQTSGALSLNDVEYLPKGTEISQPYWLRDEPGGGMFHINDATLIGRPENPPVFPVENVFEVAGQTLVVPNEPVGVSTVEGKEVRRRMSVVSPVVLHFAEGVRLFGPGATRDVEVGVVAQRGGTTGTLSLVIPSGWKAEPASAEFHLGKVGDSAKVVFHVTAPQEARTGTIVAQAKVNGVRYDNDRQEISFKHLPTILLQPTARLKAVSLELATKGKVVGYLPGAGDSVADAIAEMGYTVKTLTGDDLTAETLGKLDAVVVGIRAFNVRADLPPKLDALFEYVNNGGTVVEQYNTPNGLLSPKFTPYVVRLSGNLPANRVTDPAAVVTLLAPDNPVLNTPNKIVQSDFAGWQQERGVNMPNDWDHEHFVPLLACSDKGEKPLESGILVAKYGKGTFVYTGLSFFRQLPAGVPGAYRLFANMVSAGK